jgi:hypothetical protein
VTDGEKMEGSCSTGQSPQHAVVPVEEEEEEELGGLQFKVAYLNTFQHYCFNLCQLFVTIIKFNWWFQQIYLKLFGYFYHCTVHLDIIKVFHSPTDALVINLRKL